METQGVRNAQKGVHIQVTQKKKKIDSLIDIAASHHRLETFSHLQSSYISCIRVKYLCLSLPTMMFQNVILQTQ